MSGSSGQCDCPVFVSGRVCDSCQEGAFGNPTIGCTVSYFISNYISYNTDTYTSFDPPHSPVAATSLAPITATTKRENARMYTHMHMHAHTHIYTHTHTHTHAHVHIHAQYTHLLNPIFNIYSCLFGVGGDLCDRCGDIFYGFSPEGCTACNCNSEGSDGLGCDDSGQCTCKV